MFDARAESNLNGSCVSHNCIMESQSAPQSKLPCCVFFTNVGQVVLGFFLYLSAGHVKPFSIAVLIEHQNDYFCINLILWKGNPEVFCWMGGRPATMQLFCMQLAEGIHMLWIWNYVLQCIFSIPVFSALCFRLLFFVGCKIGFCVLILLLFSLW